MKRIILFLSALLLLSCSRGETDLPDYPISPVSIRNVSISDNFWLPKIKLVQDTTIRYAFDKCEEEGRMQNFLVAGGKKAGAYKGKMPFDDTDLYKIIEGASYSLVSQPNPELDAYIDSMITIIKTGQEPDGYLTTWFTIDKEKPPAWWVKPSSRRWEQVVSSHELYNSGHMFEAAAAHYWATGKRSFLDIAIKNADLLAENFNPGKLSTPPGHQIVETGLIKLYHITHNKKYLDLAKFFLDVRGDSTSHELYGAYSQDHMPVTEQTEAVGHAVRALYMYAGMTDIAAVCHDKDYLDAVNKIWENTFHRKMYITGGLGSRHEGESFGDDYELPNLTAYNETCASIGSVYWNHKLFMLTGDSKYYDIIEKTLYNGLISGISLDGKKFFYPNPTESDGNYKFNQGACTRKSWFDCSCCPTNLIRFIPSIPGLIYASHKDSLYVNLFMSNTARVTVDGEELELIQKTEYPWNGKINFTVNPGNEKSFTLKIRIPGWAVNEAVPGDLYFFLRGIKKEISLTVNGGVKTINLNKGYAEITRVWEKGDEVELTLPLIVREIIANEKVKDDINKVAFQYGPLVYCGEEVDNSHLSEISIPDDVKLSLEKGLVLTEKVNSIVGEYNDTKFTLIPYHLWSNRGVGKMKVWFPRSKR
ncbi:MAG: glycoside hydrolase family 127 protein [Melioribacteraceae bacterium]|nr:glycoside hydrolase family 127 protein [Melioribacteraceae bacterium]